MCESTSVTTSGDLKSNKFLKLPLCPKCGGERIRDSSKRRHKSLFNFFFYESFRCRDCRYHFERVMPSRIFLSMRILVFISVMLLLNVLHIPIRLETENDLLFSFSSAYHLLRAGPRLHEWLRRLDHSALFLLIAGSFTPVCYLLLAPGWRWLMLGSIWAIALAGVGYKLIAGMRFRRAFVGVYLAMGWLGVVPALLVFELLPPAAFVLLVGGGLLYSVGAIFYATNWPNPFPGIFEAHEIWHLFVIGGAASHYLVHLLYLVKM